MHSLDANDLAASDATSYLSLLIIYTKDKLLCSFYLKQVAWLITGNATANPIQFSNKIYTHLLPSVATTGIYDACNEWMPCGELNLEK